MSDQRHLYLPSRRHLLRDGTGAGLGLAGAGLPGSPVRARAVGDHDARRKGQGLDAIAQPADGDGQRRLLVVHRHHDLDQHGRLVAGPADGLQAIELMAPEPPGACGRTLGSA